MRRLMILGGGTAGTMAANKLYKELDKGQWQITVTMATHMMNKSLEEPDIPSVPEFLELIKASGAKIWACRLSADMNHLDESDLFDGLDGIINASDLIELTEGAQLLFI